MTGRIAIFGYGPVGRATAARLLAEGREVFVAQRRAPPDLPKASGLRAVRRARWRSRRQDGQGKRQFVVAIGFPYSGVVWRDAWPRAIMNFVAASKATGARMVFIDNLYMYGPQTAPLVETMPLADTAGSPRRARPRPASGWTPRPRARRASPRCAPRTSMGRASASPFSATPRSATSRRASPRCSSARRTSCTTTPMCRTSRARRPLLLAAPDSAFGQAWHAPCAPTRTTRDILKIAAEALGVKLRISAMPAWMLGASAMFSPFLGELTEMRFQWDRPYHVDASRFAPPSGRTRRRSRPASARLRSRSAPR